MNRLEKNPSGFSTIEIICVLVILGILSAAVVPRMSSTKAYDTAMEIEILKNHLRYAQSRAMSHNETWGMSITSNSYTLRKNGSAATTNLPNEDSPTHALNSGVSITSGNQIVDFDSLGNPGNADIVITFSNPEGGSPGCGSWGSAHTGGYQITITRTTGFVD